MKIGIIGLGLIGGSIFKELRTLGKYCVIGISTSVKEQNVYESYEKLRECDLVFVCTPMNAILDVLERLDAILPSSTIVTDVCSLKSFVCQKQYNFNFIPSHPMAGTENKGWKNSFIGLFKGAKWAITPKNGVVDDSFELLNAIIKDLGAEVIITTPEEHDEAVALISHFPLLVAQSLCESIKNNELAQELASSGFRDTTRLALSNTELAVDLVNLNNDNIKKAFNKFNDSFNLLLEADYRKKSEEILDFRKKLYS